MTPRPASFAGVKGALHWLWRRLRGGQLSSGRAGWSVAIGLFVGSLPLYGLHLPLCAAVCVPLRLDVLVAYAAAHVSNPLIAPFLVVAEVNVGAFVLTGDWAALDLVRARRTGVSGFLVQAAVGALLVGAVLAVVGGGLTFVLVEAYRRRRHAADS